MIEFALFMQVAFFVGVCLVYVSARSTSFFHPLGFYLIFHFLVFVLRPIMVHVLDYDTMWRYMRYQPDEFEFVNTLFISTVGLLAFAVMSLMSGRCRTEFSFADLPPWDVAEKRAFSAVAVILGPFAVYSGVFASAGTNVAGANIEMVRDVATGVAIYTNTTGYIAEAHSMLGALCILALWRFNFRWWAYLPFVMFIGYRSFLGWGRWGIITSFFSLVLIYLYRHNRRWLKLRHLLMAIPVAVLFQNLGMNRDLVRDYVEGGNASNRVAEAPLSFGRGDVWEQFDGPDFANFDFLAYVTWVVPEKSKTYTYFTQYLQLFTEPIPRIIWKEKPIGQPIQLIYLNDYGEFTGMTVSLVGDGWMSFGWIGVVLTLGLVGWFLGRTHRWFWMNQSNPKVVMTYCIFLPLTIQWYRDGGISIAKFALFSLMPIILWIFFTKMVGASLRVGQPSARPPGQSLHSSRER